MYPENDELCASIISQVISQANTNNDSRAASSTFDIMRDRNQVYALRQKMFGPYIPKTRTNSNTIISSQSRSASISENTESTKPIRNKVFALRRVMFGHYSK